MLPKMPRRKSRPRKERVRLFELRGGICHAKKGEPLQWLKKHSNYHGKECLIWPFTTVRTEYSSISLPTGKWTKAHRYMCTLAHGKPNSNHVAMHSCDNKGCVNPNHLKWGTHKQNSQDAVSRGKTPTGESCSWAKLSNEDIPLIKKDRKSGLTYTQLSEKWRISRGSIWHVINGTQWKHVE